MQIHEITVIQEGVLSTIGNDIKSAVTAPFQKAKHMLNTPGSFTSARGEADARDKYYTELVGQQQQAKLGTWAKQLAGEWSKQSVQATAPTSTPATPATLAKPPSFGPAYKNVTTNAPAGVPNPTAATGLPQATTATKPTVVAKPTPTTAPVTAPTVAKQRTGGKQPGVVSQTPNAIRQRNSRAQATTPTGNSFGQMAQQLSGANKSVSSTGGTTTQMPTGKFHAAKPQATPAAVPDTAATKTAPKWLTPTTKMTKSAPGKPTADEYAKLQQRIAAADAKQRGTTNEAASAVSGAPDEASQRKYAQDFKTWAASKVEDKSSGLGLDDVEKMPGMSQSLDQALANVVATQQDPKNNQTAVEKYLILVGQAMQKLSAEQRAKQRQQGGGNRVSSFTPLSSVLNPKQIEDLKTMAKDPYAAREIKTALGLR